MSNVAKIEYERLYAHLTSLLDVDPHEAIRLANEIEHQHPEFLNLQASILCDAAISAGDISAAKRAVEIFGQLREKYPSRQDYAYNLANALTSQTSLNDRSAPRWHGRTRVLRAQARTLYLSAGHLQVTGQTCQAAQALCNLGNNLDSAYRWVEAFDCYCEALQIDPSHGVASGAAALMLHRIANLNIHGHQGYLRSRAAKFAHHAQANSEHVAALAGASANASFAKLPAADIKFDAALQPSAYQRFVVENRLMLSPVPDGEPHHEERWDDIHIASLSSILNTKVPELFAMFNVVKADFLLARELLFEATYQGDNEVETGTYIDTLDYATYGLCSARLVLAQRSTFDILDKLAVALNRYLNLGLPNRAVHFRSFADTTALDKHIQQNNFGVLALRELSYDLCELHRVEVGPIANKQLRNVRNQATHAFTVLHDFGEPPEVESSDVTHHKFADYQRLAITTLRMAKAAIIYAIDAIALNERQKPKAAMELECFAPNHHDIRVKPPRRPR